MSQLYTVVNRWGITYYLIDEFSSSKPCKVDPDGHEGTHAYADQGNEHIDYELDKWIKHRSCFLFSIFLLMIGLAVALLDQLWPV